MQENDVNRQLATGDFNRNSITANCPLPIGEMQIAGITKMPRLHFENCCVSVEGVKLWQQSEKGAPPTK
jgi:hypothetical protein